MATTATFNQVLGNKTVQVQIPVTRITKLIDKVDDLIDAGKIKQAEKLLTPFIMKPMKGFKKGELIIMNSSNFTKGAKKEQALELIAKLVELGQERSKIIAQLQHDLQMTYANARHYVVNVAKV
jgi:hypothetical protein